MQVLTLAEAAAFLRISPYTLREQVSAGKVPGAKVGGEWRFTDESLEAHMRNIVSGANERASSTTRRRPAAPPPLGK